MAVCQITANRVVLHLCKINRCQKTLKCHYRHTKEEMAVEKYGNTVDSAISYMVKKITEEFDPHSIILFGSRARGDAKKDSDVDIMVVFADSDVELSRYKDRIDMITQIRTIFYDSPVSKDILVATQRELERWSKVVGTIQHYVVNEGKIIYERQ